MTPAEQDYINWYYVITSIGMTLFALKLFIAGVLLMVSPYTKDKDATRFIAIFIAGTGLIYGGPSVYEFTKVRYTPGTVLIENARSIPQPEGEHR